MLPDAPMDEATQARLSARKHGVVLGAAPHGIGAYALRRYPHWSSAGLAGERYRWDIREGYHFLRSELRFNPKFVIDTIGVNEEAKLEDASFHQDVFHLMQVNYSCHMSLISEWAIDNRNRWSSDNPGVFVVVSSNSAQIARSPSPLYCSSKAALSMGVRAIARKFAAEDWGLTAMVVEPGWVDGTPMSTAVSASLPAGTAPHRIPGGRGIHPAAVADQIGVMMNHPHAFNGCAVRIDGGEQ